MLTLSTSLRNSIAELTQRFPQTPFLSLGQTVFWDEPLKAAFCRALEQLAPHSCMIGAVHNTDYFAKLPGSTTEEEGFVMLGHNDGATRELWSAAGEISAFFGSEVMPTRAKLTAAGVPFDRLARRHEGGMEAFFEEFTQAFGWRALVQKGSRTRVADDVALGEIYPALRGQLQWAFEQSLQVLGQSQNSVSDQMLQWLDEFYESHPQANLTQCYRFLIPKLWTMVRGEAVCPLRSSCTTELLQFNKSTFHLPRFHLLSLFLNPQTREKACECYNRSVKNGGMYQLSQFGEGALPFDVVIAGEGRGTLRLHENNVIVETATPHVLCSDCRCETLRQLAQLLESTFGPDVTIIGKAVTLISMLAAEYIFVFHEKASPYTAQTQLMNQLLQEAGMELSLHPMLRLRHSAWDGLGEVKAQLHLPAHLARAFGKPEIAATEFSKRWQDVCEKQGNLREELAALRSPRDLLRWLAQDEPDWQEVQKKYQARREEMDVLRARIEQYNRQASELRQKARRVIQKSIALEQDKGQHWREKLLPLKRQIEDIRESTFERQKQNATQKLSKSQRREQTEIEAQEDAQIEGLEKEQQKYFSQRQEFARDIKSLRAKARQARSKAQHLIEERVEVERSSEMRRLRQELRVMEMEAETERLSQLRDAILTSEGLRYTNVRPTAWWLPMVSPDGAWFEGLVSRAQARVEELQ